MLFSVLLAGLLAEIVASTSYSIPVEMAVEADCVMPSEYTISDFMTLGSQLNGTTNTTSFHFIDSDTGIDTDCERNSTSKTSTTSPNATPRWPCNDGNVEFIYQTNGLTVIEAACPGSSSSDFEASGLTTFNLSCVATYDGTLCSSTQASITDNFTSLEPQPA
ncbi:hypothetical protein BJ170DRAFT_453446 [Xylariales sp. AK1849]|nr:hypothetical protein BJ170DRAFT_453446 [Xylariales sp. AK1849]